MPGVVLNTLQILAYLTVKTNLQGGRYHFTDEKIVGQRDELNWQKSEDNWW